MPAFDVVVLTDSRYIDPPHPGQYVQNILLEDELVSEALTRKGLKVTRKAWTDDAFDWANTKAVLFRTTWDYTDHIQEFRKWLSEISPKTRLINTRQIIEWNLNKRYLLDLQKKNVRVVPTSFIDMGSESIL